MSPNESSSAKRAPVPTRGPQAPRFIVIEGPLRVGKSTLAKILAERAYRQEGLPRRNANLPRVHRRSRPRLRTFLLPLRRFRSIGHQHFGNRLRRTQRRPAAAPPPPPRSGKRHPVFPTARPLLSM